MFKKLIFILLSLLIITSCATETDIDAVNDDGSPIWTTIVPESNKYVYGVGRAKLSNEANSTASADADARADLASKLQSTIKEATSNYTNDSEGDLRNAYEQITIQFVEFTMRGVKTEQHWTAPDGTVWSLVSLEAKTLDDQYALAANDYLTQIEAKKVETESKLADLLELGGLVVLSDESLDRADGGEVLLGDLVHIVVLLQHLGEAGVDDDDADDEPHHDDGESHGEDYSKLRVDGDRHRKRHDEHDGSAHEHADDHHIGHLHVGDVGGETSHQPGGAETVEVGEAEILHLIVDLLPDVGAEARRGIRSIAPGQHAEEQRKQRHDHHYAAADRDEFYARIHGEQLRVGSPQLKVEGVRLRPLRKSDVDDLRHDDGDEHLQHHLEHDEDGGEHGSRLILSHAPRKSAQHVLLFCSLVF